MALQGDHQQIVDVLYARYRAKGFIQEEEALTLMAAKAVSLRDTERLTGILIGLGVIFTGDGEPDRDQSVDGRQTKYDPIFFEILSIAPGQKTLIDYIRNTRSPQSREWVTLIPQARSGNRYALNRLFSMYLRVVVKLALSVFKREGYELDDLLQEGSIGLMRAIERYDPTRHGSFAAYVPLWIWQFLGRAIAEKRDAVRVPAHVFEAIRESRRTPNRQETASGFRLSGQKTTDKLGISGERARQVDSSLFHLESIEEYVIEHHDGFAEYEIAETRISSTELAEASVVRDQILNILDVLTSREADVLRLRFGLNDGSERTLKEVGEVFCLTKERIRQIESNALKKLRKPPVSERLAGFLGF